MAKKATKSPRRGRVRTPNESLKGRSGRTTKTPKTGKASRTSLAGGGANG